MELGILTTGFVAKLPLQEQRSGQKQGIWKQLLRSLLRMSKCVGRTVAAAAVCTLCGITLFAECSHV